MGNVKQEACELFIEQEIEDGLKQGKTPYSLGKEISAWLEKLFEAKVAPRTVEQRARRAENATNVASDPTPEDDSENGGSGGSSEPKTVGELVEQGSSVREAARIVAERTGQDEERVRTQYRRDPENELAQRFAFLAIKRLEEILPDDPGRQKALTGVAVWCIKAGADIEIIQKTLSREKRQ